MKICVDELPNSSSECIFAKLYKRYRNFPDEYLCRLSNAESVLCYINDGYECPYLFVGGGIKNNGEA